MSVQKPTIRVGQHGESLLVIALVGEHDLATVPELESALRAVERAGTPVVLDFSEATFVDSSIIRVVISQAGKDGESVVVVSPPNTTPRRTFDLVRLGAVVRVCDKRDDAPRVLRRH